MFDNSRYGLHTATGRGGLNEKIARGVETERLARLISAGDSSSPGIPTPPVPGELHGAAVAQMIVGSAMFGDRSANRLTPDGTTVCTIAELLLGVSNTVKIANSAPSARLLLIRDEFTVPSECDASASLRSLRCPTALGLRKCRPYLITLTSNGYSRSNFAS